MKVTPYDTGKIKIGIYYEPKSNYYNEDQDWVQEALLGIKPDWTKNLDSYVEYACLFAVFYCVLGLLARG